MRWTLLVLAAMLLPATSGLAQDGVMRPQIAPPAEQETEPPAPQLVRLDGALMKAQEDKRQGRIDEKRYQEFLVKFRADLAAAMALVKPTPPNAALHVRILSSLGDSEQALAALGPALEQDPTNLTLRVALGQVRYDQKDYPAALAEANAILARDSANKAALALKYSSEGRIGTGGAAASTKESPKVRALIPEDSARRQRVQQAIGHIDNAKAALLAGRGDEALEWANKAVQTDPTPTAMKFAEEVRKIVDEGKVDEVPYNPKTPAPKDGGMPLWPVLPISGLGAAAYVVAKSRKTVESEDGFNEDDRPQPGELQRFVAGSILAGLAGAGLYLGAGYVVGMGVPLAARFMAASGQQAVATAQTEPGLIAPRSIAAASAAAPSAKIAAEEAAEVVRQVVIKKGEILNRVWDSRWGAKAAVSGPAGSSYCWGQCLPLNASAAIQRRGLSGISGLTNNAQAGATYRVTEDIVVRVQKSIGGVDPEVIVSKADIGKLQQISESVSKIPSGTK